jgi:hypothetical protein
MNPGSLFVARINHIISEVVEELRRRQAGVPGDGSELQLSDIIDELEGIKKMVNLRQLPPRDQRYTAFSYHVLDEWALQSPLSIELCDVAEAYKNLVL